MNTEIIKAVIQITISDILFLLPRLLTDGVHTITGSGSPLPSYESKLNSLSLNGAPGKGARHVIVYSPL
jgi:hypothetical protein